MKENTKDKTSCVDKQGNRMYRLPNPDSDARKNPGRSSFDARKIPERSSRNTSSLLKPQVDNLDFLQPAWGNLTTKISWPPRSKNPPSCRPNSPHLLRQPYLTVNIRNNKRQSQMLFHWLVASYSQEVTLQWGTCP